MATSDGLVPERDLILGFTRGFGINAPGWFMKTEYRAAYLDRKHLEERVDGTNAAIGQNITFKPFVQTISTSLVYRFNWGGAGVRY